MNRPTRNICLAVFTATVLAAGSAMAAAADAFPTTPPAAGPAPTLHLPAPSSSTLANGLQVISVARSGLPLVTAQLLVRRGGEMDPAGRAGLAELTATLLTRGAAGKSAPQIAAEAEALGGSLSASAGWDQSAVDITVTTPKLPQALALLAQVVRQPDFAAAELTRARRQALDDLQLLLSRPTALAALAANRAIFGGGAYGHSRAGSPASLARITRADVQRLHAALYRPDNAILVLTGDITPAQARQLAQRSFGDWLAPATALAAVPTVSAASDLPPVLLIDQHGAGQAGVVIAHAAPARRSADYYASTVANAVLGGSYSARLNEEIRIKRGLSYGAGSSLDLRRDAGLWLASAQTKNPSAPQVIELMLGEFGRLAGTPVGTGELAARKATLVGAYGRSLETTAGLAAEVGELAVYGVDLAELGRAIERIQAVTPAQIEAYAATHLGGAGTRVVVVGDAAQFDAAVKKAHPHAQSLQADRLDLDSASLRAPANATPPAH